jgi:hypothetical protein
MTLKQLNELCAQLGMTEDCELFTEMPGDDLHLMDIKARDENEVFLIFYGQENLYMK